METNSDYNFNSLDLIRFIFKHKIPVIIITMIAAIASIIVALTIPEKFKSTVVLFPKTQVSASQALSSAELIKSENHILNFGDEEATEQLLQTLHSEDIRFKIIDKFDLMNHYKIEQSSEFPMTLLHQEYDNNISYRRTDYQAIEIEVLDADPQVAANIANEISSLLDSTLNNMQRDVAIKILEIVESEYLLLKDEIQEIEASMAKLRKQGVGATDPQYISLAGLLSEETVRFSKLKAKYAEARVDATQDLPRKFTVTRAYAAEKKAYPIRWLIVVISTLSAFLFSVLFMLFFERYKDLIGIK